MAALYDARGKGNADLVLHYSPKAKRNVQLSGQLQFLHFLYCEIDCHIATADYLPRSAISSLAGDKFAALVDAQVETSDGKVIWHRLIASEPDEEALTNDLRAVLGKGPLAGISALETWTTARLTANPMRLRNSLRAVAWMSAARHWPLAEFKSNALTLISKRRSVIFGDLRLEEVASRFRSKRKDLWARFLMKPEPFAGISSVEDLKFFLSEYDNTKRCEYPAGSKLSYSEFFLPRAYASGWLLGDEAQNAWDAFVRSAASVNRNLGQIGMQWVGDTVTQFLTGQMASDVAKFKSTPDDWDAAVLHSKFIDSMI